MAYLNTHQNWDGHPLQVHFRDWNYIYRPQRLLNENVKEILMHFLMLFNLWQLIVNIVVLLQEIVIQICLK